jgi:hypothetical protein
MTKYLVLTSMVLSFVSYFVVIKGGTELYPFFHFKLYSQPMGNKMEAREYRVYEIIGRDTLRHSIEAIRSFDKDAYAYFLDGVTNDILRNKNKAENMKRLAAFLNYLYPNHGKMMVVQETYNQFELEKDPTLFTKIILIDDLF